MCCRSVHSTAHVFNPFGIAGDRVTRKVLPHDTPYHEFHPSTDEIIEVLSGYGGPFMRPPLPSDMKGLTDRDGMTMVVLNAPPEFYALPTTRVR